LTSIRVRREGFDGQTVVVGWHDIVVAEEARKFDDVGVAGMLTRGGRNSRSARDSRGIEEVQVRRGRLSNRTAPKQFPTA